MSRYEGQYNRNYKNWNERRAMFTERQREIKDKRTTKLINKNKKVVEENIWDRIKNKYERKFNKWIQSKSKLEECDEIKQNKLIRKKRKQLNIKYKG